MFTVTRLARDAPELPQLNSPLLPQLLSPVNLRLRRFLTRPAVAEPFQHLVQCFLAEDALQIEAFLQVSDDLLHIPLQAHLACPVVGIC